MGYTGTTNYGFQKPAKENAFTVDDLNNALDKIDETIKDESPSILSVDLDDDMNLVVKLASGDGSEIEDSTSLSKLIDSAGMGLLIVPTSFIGTAKITITDAFETVVVNNQNITGNIPLTNGQYKVSVTQFNNVTKEANVLVLGNTNLEMDFSIFTLAVDGVESITVGGISIPVGNVTVLKNDTDVEVKLTLETIGTGLTFTVTKTMNCANDATITADRTDALVIQSNTTITIQKTAEYEVWACGGGAGGSGGSGSEQDRGYYYGGHGGVGGDGGYVVAKMLNLNAQTAIPITIGAGGSGGAGGEAGGGYGTKGGNGGTTTFGTYFSASGGQADAYSSSIEANGGDGSNSKNMDIFGNSVAFGSGGESNYSGTTVSGGKSAIDNSLLYPTAGDGGNSGIQHTSGSSTIFAKGGTGGKGGNGLSETLGKGGDGGNGPDCTNYPTGEGPGANGTKGFNGAVTIVRLIA